MKTVHIAVPLGGLLVLLSSEPKVIGADAPAALTNSISTRKGVPTGATQSHVLTVSSSPPGRMVAGERSDKGRLLAVKKENEESKSSEATTFAVRTTTYARDIMPILMGKCIRCHNDQTRFLDNWLDYKAAFGERREIKRRVWNSWKGEYFKQPMPTVNSPESEVMTEEERQMIRDWVDQGAVYGVPPIESNPRTKTERIELGKRLFNTICAACHQPSGQGIPNRFPPLAGSDFLNSDKKRAIEVLLNGLQGEVVVNGQKFNNSMPLFPFSDGDIAAALTYVYSSFGNSAQDVTPEEVKALRGHTEGINPVGKQGNEASAPGEKSPWE